MRIVQPPSDRTGSPTWTVPVDAAVPFERDGIRIPRYDWHSELIIAVTCAPSVADAHLCAGEAVGGEPPVCAYGYVQTAYDQCCRGSLCVDPEGRPSIR